MTKSLKKAIKQLKIAERIMEKYELSKIDDIQIIEEQLGKHFSYLENARNSKIGLNSKELKQINKDIENIKRKISEIENLKYILNSENIKCKGEISSTIHKKKKEHNESNESLWKTGNAIIVFIVAAIGLVMTIESDIIKRFKKDDSISLSTSEIEIFLDDYNRAYTEAIKNKKNYSDENQPIDYFKDIVEEDSKYAKDLNEYILNSYDIDTYTYTVNYKNAEYDKDKSLIIINNADIDSINNQTNEPIIQPSNQLKRVFFEVVVEEDNENKTILIKDKLDEYEVKELYENKN